MRWLAILLSLVMTVCWTTPAEAKFIFRDGKWVFVPDDEELPPPRPAPVEPTPSPTPSEVAPTPKPPVEPTPAPPVEPAPAPQPTPTVEPPTKTPPVEPTPTKPEPPKITLPSESPLPPASPVRAEPAGQPVPAEPSPKPAPAPEVPRVPAAPLDLPQATSVGEKYRTPEPSKAADQAESLVANVSPPQADAAERLTEAIAAFRKGDYGTTESLAKKLIKAYPHSRYAEAAQWLRAEAIFSSGDFYQPYQEYETFLKTYAGSPLVDQALLREFQCAEALFGPARRKVIGLPLFSGDDEAMAMLEKLYAHRPTGPLAADAVFRQAEHHLAKGRFIEAEEMLRKFLNEFPNHARARQAELWSAQCAMAANAGATYDDSGLTRAEDTLRAYREKYPRMAAQENVDGALEKIRHMQAERKLQRAEYYRRARRPKAARFYAQRVVDQFPGTPSVPKAQALLGELGDK